MKQFLLCLSFALGICLASFESDGQIYYHVTTANGTQTFGNLTVTVTTSGAVAYNNSNNCGINPFYSTPNAGAAYKFSFSSPVTAVRTHFIAVGPNDTMSVKINNSIYNVTNSNLSSYSGSCNPTNTVIGYNGNIVDTSSSLAGAAQFDAQPGYGINSVEYIETVAGSAGIAFDFYFMSACNVIVSAAANTPCAGDSLHLTASTNYTGTVSYSWTGPNSFSSSLQNPSIANAQTSASGTYHLTTTIDTCTYHDSVIVVVNPYPSALITANNQVCSGDSLHMSVNNSMTGVTYQWTGPNNFTNATSGPTLYNLQLNDSGYYYVTASRGACSSSDSIFIHTKPSPNIPVANSNSPVCIGDTIHFSVANPQTSVSYYWNGPQSFSVNAQTTYRANAQANYAGFYTVIANLNGCTEFGIASVSVNALVGPPTISISSNPGDSVCAGQGVTLTAVAANAGSPVYQWKSNGVNIPGANFAVYLASTVTNNENFVCEVHSSLFCQHTDSAISNSETMHLIVALPPIISISSSPQYYSSGTTVTFTGHVPAGSTNLAFGWTRNGQKIPLANTISYTSSNVSAGDVICFVAYSSALCVDPDSSVACMSLALGVNNMQTAGSDVKVWPNPFNEDLTLSLSEGEGTARVLPAEVKIFNIVGQLVYSSIINSNKAQISTKDLAKGVYLLQLTKPDGGSEVRKLLKD